jgi:hypothetical protein
LGTSAKALRMKCVRHRCQLEPWRTAAIAAFSPSWASLVTNFTPLRPRATRLRRKACQKCTVLAGAHVEPEHFTSAVLVHADADDDRHADDAVLLPDPSRMWRPMNIRVAAIELACSEALDICI